MPRPETTDILFAGLMGAGLILTNSGLGHGLGQVVGGIFVVGAGTWAMAELLKLRGRCRRIASTLEAAGDARFVEPANLVKASPNLLGTALSDALSSARRSAVTADMRACELEIRLRISESERAYAESIIQGISEAVVVTDPSDDVILTNESAASALKFDLEGANRTPIRKLVRDRKIVERVREMRKTAGRGGSEVVDHEVTHGDTTKSYKVVLSSLAETATNGTPPRPEGAGVVAVMHDVTHEREIAQLKNEFISNVSHELRTPLASIKAYAELLIDGEVTDETAKREFYNVIHYEANRLGRLIDNILTVSKIESGLARPERTPMNLLPVLREAIETVLPVAIKKNITVNDRTTPRDYRASVDRDMIFQAIHNLIGNAVRYTVDGGVVEVDMTIDENRRKLLICVSDTGVGIPQKDLPHIFDKFYRSEGGSRMARGTGLGLTLAKHVIETIHGGRIFVESRAGKGSRFGFELDACEPKA